MNNAQMLSALLALPDADYMHETKLDTPIGLGTSYSARTVVLLLEKERRKRARIVKAVRALLSLDLENDGATCDWEELQQALTKLQASIDGQKPNAELSRAPQQHQPGRAECRGASAPTQG